MSGETENPEAGESAPKKPYATPELIEYGRAADLTGGGTSASPESGNKNSMMHA